MREQNTAVFILSYSLGYKVGRESSYYTTEERNPSLRAIACDRSIVDRLCFRSQEGPWNPPWRLRACRNVQVGIFPSLGGEELPAEKLRDRTRQ